MPLRLSNCILGACAACAALQRRRATDGCLSKGWILARERKGKATAGMIAGATDRWCRRMDVYVAKKQLESLRSSLIFFTKNASRLL